MMKKLILSTIVLVFITFYSYSEFADVYFVNENTGIVVGEYGIIMKSTNSGINWFYQTSGTSQHIYNVFFNNTDTGMAVGSNGLILRTTNGGLNWNVIVSGTNSWFKDIKFIDVNTGYIVGSDGAFLRTINNGLNWSLEYIGSDDLMGVNFINMKTGFICGLGSKIGKTTNQGDTWEFQVMPLSFAVCQISFLDSNTGIATAGTSYGAGIIFRTTNGGLNWNWIPPYLSGIYGICPVNTNKVFVGGEKIYCSTNAGINWVSQVTSPWGNIGSIIFLNENTGMAVGASYFRTTNGGINWLRHWITAVNEVNSEVPIDFSLSQNYPNPFNPKTKIKFEVPKASFTKLIIYDLLGREVATLVNEELKPGTYEADWDGSNYSSGVYFYKLVVGDPSTGSGRGFVETKKMVLMK